MCTGDKKKKKNGTKSWQGCPCSLPQAAIHLAYREDHLQFYNTLLGGLERKFLLLIVIFTCMNVMREMTSNMRSRRKNNGHIHENEESTPE